MLIYRATAPVQARAHLDDERTAQYTVAVVPGGADLRYNVTDVALLVEHLSSRDLMALADLLPVAVRRTLAAGLRAANLDAR